jgi:lysozyme
VRASFVAAIAFGVFLLMLSRRATANFGNVAGITPKGIDLLKAHEGFRATVYLDQAGIETIGYGHRVLPGEQFGTIDSVEATRILIDDVSAAAAAVRGLVVVPLMPHEFDALTSLVFNIGRTAFANSTLLKRLNADDRKAAAAEFERWVFVTVNGNKQRSAGLAARRSAERKLFEGHA